MFYPVLICRVYKGNYSTLESRTGKAAAIDSLQRAHDIVDGDQLGTAALIIADAAFTGVENKLSEKREIARLPCSHPLAHAAVFRIEMFGTAGEPGRHHVAGLVESLLGDVPQESFLETFQRLFMVRKHVPCRRLAFIDPEVIVAVDKIAGKAGEEDAYLKVRHMGMASDDAVFITVTIQEEQSFLPSQGDAGLVEDSVIQPDVFTFRLGGYLYDFEGGERDSVRLGHCHDVSDQHCRGGAETAHGKRALYHAFHAVCKVETFLHGVFRPTDVVAPVLFPHFRTFRKVNLHFALESLGMKSYHRILPDIEPQVDALIDGKACDQAMLMVDMGTKGAYPVRGEDVVLIISFHISCRLLYRCPTSRCQNEGSCPCLP